MPKSRYRAIATLIGFTAILMWALLAAFTIGARGIPPFQLLGLTFAVAFAVSLPVLGRKGRRAFRIFRQPWPVWGLGVGGLFGYHLFYFIALGNAPAAEASLIAYLWPLLIVLFSALLPGERLRRCHVAGAVAGLCGAAVLILDQGEAGLAVAPEHLFGYGAAMLCALTWSGYSVLNRRFGDVPTDVVGGFCGATALLALICHGLAEDWITPTALQWLAIIALGLGPVGAAFFVWDYGTKNGDIQLLGVLSYTAPLLSTLVLVVLGQAEPDFSLFIACMLIIGGAGLAGAAMWVRFLPAPLAGWFADKA